MKIICSDDHRTECPVEEELDVLRSTAAHVMAQAVKRLYPEAQLARGTATENGFRYDFRLRRYQSDGRGSAGY